jgi:predicted glycosyltransferase
MKVWIDLSNSPHPLLFRPLAERLEAWGHEVRVTARDNAQTVELAREHWPEVDVIGDTSPSGRAAKARSLLGRVRELAQWSRRERPDIALSHNSYAQICAARWTGVRAITAMDYEHQPANHLAFRLADLILLPTALRSVSLRRKGARSDRVRFYDGLKEEIYLGDFRPDPTVVAQTGVYRDPGTVLVVARTPPSAALYHRFENPLFTESLKVLASRSYVRCVVLTRRPEERDLIAGLGLANVVVPEAALPARSLMYCADLVIGAGGTMTREAALLGVPTLSLFAGKEAAVDTALERVGALKRIRRTEDLPIPGPRDHEPRHPDDLHARSETLIDEFLQPIVGAPAPARPVPVAA